MVKLVGNDTMEEIKLYFDYENNFQQLLEDYLHKSGEVESMFNKSKNNNKSQFIRLMKFQLKTMYEKGDHEKPRMKQFKTWMESLCEQKIMKHNKKDNDLEKDELIRTLQESITNLKNENYQHRKKINKLKKKIEEMEVKPEPESSPEPSTEILKRMDPDYDSDDDIIEKISPPVSPPASEPSIYSNHLSAEEEKEKDEYEQQLKKQCESIAIQKEEDIENKNKIEKVLDTYYSQCDLKMDVIYKRFNKEVKKADRTNKKIKNDYIDEFEIYLEELRDEYLEEHDELSSYFNKMFDKPSRLFEDLLPSEMMPIPTIN